MKGKWIAWLGVALFFVSGFVTVNVNENVGAAMTLASLAVVIFGFVRSWKEGAPVRKQRMEEKQRKAAELREELAAEREAKKDAQRKSHIIMEVKLLDGGSNIRKRSGLGGAVVGGLVAGPVGAVVGANVKKAGKKNRQRFAVRYADGHITTVEVEPGSSIYNKLMKFVKWEEIK